MPPLVAITTTELRTRERADPLPHSEPPRHELALSLTYPTAVEQGGAVPMVVPPMPFEDVEPLLDRIDGLVLSGGPDVDPSTYGAEPHPTTGPTLRDLDDLELRLLDGARRRGMAILALCRGMQLLNVGYGGTLIQDIPQHRQKAPGAEPHHDVALDPSSQVAGVMGATAIGANSFHHQAVERVGEGLRVVGRAPDGTIEAVEDPDAAFVLGVQWHAESMTSRTEHLALFEAFTRAASRGPVPT